MGRPRKPTSQRAPGKRADAKPRGRENEVVVTALTTLPDPPDGLTVAGATFWRETGARMMAEDMLAATDLPMLRELAITFGAVESLRSQIRKEGRIITGPRGARGAHPAIAILTQELRRLDQLMHKAGLTPSGRIGIAKASGRSEEGWERFATPPRSAPPGERERPVQDRDLHRGEGMEGVEDQEPRHVLDRIMAGEKVVLFPGRIRPGGGIDE